MLFLTDADVARLLPIEDAIEQTEQGFRLLATGQATNAPRQRTAQEGATLNVMWALAPTRGVAGVKSYTVVRQDVSQGTTLVQLVYSSLTGELLAVLEANRLGQLRTGAATAVATRALARPDSSTLALIGTGFQAEYQARALVALAGLGGPVIDSITVVGRHAGRRDTFAARLRDSLGLEVCTDTAAEAVATADVVVTATGSSTPVLTGDWLPVGTHVNAVGSNLAAKSEVDRRVLERADHIVLDHADSTAAECGDLQVHGWPHTHVRDLGEVLEDPTSGRRTASEITLFESQGLALQDLLCAELVVRRATDG